MFHKNPATDNVSKCDNPSACRISNLHSDTRNSATKLYESSEKKLEKIEKLSAKDAQEILERKQMELPFILEHIDSAEKNLNSILVSQPDNTGAVNHLHRKIDKFYELLGKIEEDTIVLEVRLAELDK